MSVTTAKINHKSPPTPTPDATKIILNVLIVTSTTCSAARKIHYKATRLYFKLVL